MADVLYRNGKILTMDPAMPEAQALLTKGSRVVAVGRDAEIAGLAAFRTRTVDLQGGVMLPGFHDAHVHLTGFGLELGQLDLAPAATAAEALQLVRAWKQPGEWLLGAGFSLARWGVETLDVTALDAASPDRPVFLRSQDHHGAWLNSRALELLGITRDTPDPEGGRIQRDADGNPTGLLFESAAADARRKLPAPTDQELDAALQRAAQAFSALGVTTVHHMAAEPPSHFRRLALAASATDYQVRVWACIDQENIEAAAAIGLATGQGGRNFRIGGAKFFVDGALGSATALMSEPYEGTDDQGIAMLSAEELTHRVGLAATAGLVPVTHAIGDLAVSRTIDAYVATRHIWEPAGLRPRLEHAQHISREDVRRMADAGIIASIQPIHLTFDAPAIPRLLGSRADRAFVLREMLEAGVPLAFGSDVPVAPPGVMEGLLAATTRRDIDGAAFMPEQSVDADTALAAYTRGAAVAAGMGKHSGRLAAGYDADMVVLAEDPRERLAGNGVAMTVKGGRKVYCSE